MFLKRKKAFTLIELLIVIFTIVLIGTLVTISFLNIKKNNRDAKRINDMAEIQMVLEDYKLFEGSYPDSLVSGEPLVGHSTGNLYMAQVPGNSGYFISDCSVEDYEYSYNSSTESYQISFCLEGSIENYTKGEKCVVSGGILDYDCSANSDGPFSLNYSAGTGGYISGSQSQIVEKNQSGSTVTAVANTGYNFSKWSDDVSSAERTDTNVIRNISVAAQFQIQTFSLAYTSGTGGSISGDSSQTINYGSDGTAVTAQPNTGYNFVNWSDTSTSNPRTDTNVTSNISVAAQFQIQTFSLTYSAGTGGSISGDSSQTINYGSDGTAVTAQPSAGYAFVDWSDGSTSNPRTDTNITSSISVTANFSVSEEYFDLTYSAGTGGSVSGDVSQNVLAGSDGTAVTANPSTGYIFVNWSDGSTSNPRTDTNVTSNISVTANFQIQTFSLTYSAGTGGSISGDSSQTINYGSDGTAVTANPNTGYIFVNWSDGSTSNPRTDTNVTSNVSVTANFKTHLVPSIDSPPDASSHDEGEVINFVGSASNTQGSYTCSWSSSLDGSLGSTCNFEKNNLSVGDHNITLSVTDDLETIDTHIDISVNTITSFEPLEYSFTGTVQQLIISVAGTYKFTVVGAKGGNDGAGNNGGAGGQAIGQKYLSAGDTLFIYVGGQGAMQETVGQLGGWNGGGNAYSSITSVSKRLPGTGGGASDIRLNEGALANRIIVAAGGGGAGGKDTGAHGGAGGGLIGEHGFMDGGGLPGTQTYGGEVGGILGYGGDSNSQFSGAGGGGYYGGGASPTDARGGGGGSSFIDGLSSSSTTKAINSTGDGYIIIEYIP